MLRPQPCIQSYGNCLNFQKEFISLLNLDLCVGGRQVGVGPKKLQISTKRLESTTNIFILMCIQSFYPNSAYELAKIMDVDQSNLNKLINCFEELGAIRVEEKKVGGLS